MIFFGIFQMPLFSSFLFFVLNFLVEDYFSIVYSKSLYLEVSVLTTRDVGVSDRWKADLLNVLAFYTIMISGENNLRPKKANFVKIEMATKVKSDF